MGDDTEGASQPPPPEEALFVARLPGEVEQWRQEGLIRKEQAQALLARYGLLPGETPHTLQRSRIVLLLAILGAVLVGVGVILFVGSNWESIPKWARLVSLMAATAAAYQGGYRLSTRSQTYPKVGAALVFLGSLLWGASIFLVGQTYHMGGPGGDGERTGVLIWFIGVLPLAYVLWSVPHLVLALVLGNVWLYWTIGEVLSPYGPQAVLLPALAVGLLFYALGRLHTDRRSAERFEAAYCWLGLLSVFVVLYAFSFEGFWTFGQPRAEAQWLWPVLLLGPAAIAGVVFLLTSGRRDWTAFTEAAAILALVLLGVAVAATHPYWFAKASPEEYWNPVHREAALSMALCNLLLLAATVGVLLLGWARHRPGLATFGMLVFFVQVVTRYFDLLWGMLSSSLLFIGAGVILIGLGALLERSRRRLLTAMSRRGQP